MKLNIALCTDENFVVPALVCITSIFESNCQDECRITILTEGISEESHEKFTKLASTYHQAIQVVVINPEKFRTLKSYDRYPTSMYFRFLLPEILKEESKVLYLDCDIMVRRPLRDLFDINIKNYSCGAVIDQQCDDVQIINRLRLNTRYFNSGVMMLNLDAWRKNNYTKKLIDFIEENPNKCVFPDQDALNAVLSGTVKYLPLSYNLQEMWLTMLDYARFSYRHYPELEDAKKDPIIIHFCVNDKPWYMECKNPYKEEYLNIALLHDFIGFKQKKHYKGLYYRVEAEKIRLQRWQQHFIDK